MTSSEHMSRCQGLRGGVTASEAAIIVDLRRMEELAIGGDGDTHFYYKDLVKSAVASRDEALRVMRRLIDAAEVYSADQRYADDKRCGLVQPITVAEGQELNGAIAAAREVLPKEVPHDAT